MNSRRIDFIGINLHDVKMIEALETVDAFVTSRTPHKIFGVNVAAYTKAMTHPALLRFYHSCDLLTVDGMGIYYAARAMGLKFCETVPTSYLMFEILKRGQKSHYRVFLLGSKPQVVQMAAANLRRYYPGVELAGYEHGFFSKTEESQVVSKIAASAADVLLIGMSSPLKEEFVQGNFDRLNVPVQIGVGGALDVLAGVTNLPPRWVRTLGFEWMNRLIQEPGRLWRRYLFTNTRFGFLFLRRLAGRLFAEER